MGRFGPPNQPTGTSPGGLNPRAFRVSNNRFMHMNCRTALALSSFLLAVTGCGAQAPVNTQSGSSSTSSSVKKTFQMRAVLSTQPASESQCLASPQASPAPAVETTACTRDHTSLYVLGPAFETNENIADVTVREPVQSSDYQVDITFDEQGAHQLADASARLYELPPPQNRFAYVIDGVVTGSAFFQEPILGGAATMTGPFTKDSATELADGIRP